MAVTTHIYNGVWQSLLICTKISKLRPESIKNSTKYFLASIFSWKKVVWGLSYSLVFACKGGNMSNLSKHLSKVRHIPTDKRTVFQQPHSQLSHFSIHPKYYYDSERACTSGTSVLGLCWTSSKRELIMHTWQLTKESSTWRGANVLILWLHLALIISPVSNFPCKSLFGAGQFRCVDIHYHSRIIRSEAWWRRSNWQSNSFSACSHSWAEMWHITHLTLKLCGESIKSSIKDNSSRLSLQDRNAKPEEKPTPSLVFSYRKDFIMFSFLLGSIGNWVIKSFLWLSPLCWGCWRQQE